MVVLRWWWLSLRGGSRLAFAFLSLPHNIAANEGIIDRIADLFMNRIRYSHARVFDKTHNETGKSKASLSFTFALKGYFLQLMGKGSGYIYLDALKDVVNERAYFNHTIRKVAIGGELVASKHASLPIFSFVSSPWRAGLLGRRVNMWFCLFLPCCTWLLVFHLCPVS